MAASTNTSTTDLTVDVVDLSGETVDSIDLPATWFDGKVNIGVMHDVVTAQQAAARQGTHKTKTRGEVRGGGAKPWRQKGTGRARHGSIRSPIWVGGGVAHGRTPKEWGKRVNKKVRRAALRSALTDRARNDAVVVVRELAFASPRTRDAVAALTALELSDAKVLVVLPGLDVATTKSFRNLGGVHLLTVDQLNTYDVLASDVVVFDEAAIALLSDGATAVETAEAAAEPEVHEDDTPAASDQADDEPVDETEVDDADADASDEEE